MTITDELCECNARVLDTAVNIYGSDEKAIMEIIKDEDIVNIIIFNLKMINKRGYLKTDQDKIDKTINWKQKAKFYIIDYIRRFHD